MSNPSLIHFLSDRSHFTMGYFLNTCLLALFFSLSTGSKIEILYPLMISIWIYIIIMAVDWIHYSRFQRNIKECIENPYYDVQPAAWAHKAVIHIVEGIHTLYMNKLSTNQGMYQERTRFLSQWIHRMKTPVSVIQLIMEKEMLEKQDYQQALKRISREIDRISDSLEQVLYVIRLDEFSRDYIPETIELGTMVNQIINAMKNQFIYNHVFPIWENTNNNVKILSDVKWNRLMLEQIISNAIKYSAVKEGEKKIHLRIVPQKDRVVLSIRDEGIGIPAYDIPNVFEPFFTGENGRKIKNSTGIGLYMCSVIAQKLGHTLEIESEVGRGTEVRITYLSKM